MTKGDKIAVILSLFIGFLVATVMVWRIDEEDKNWEKRREAIALKWEKDLAKMSDGYTGEGVKWIQEKGVKGAPTGISIGIKGDGEVVWKKFNYD